MQRIVLIIVLGIVWWGCALEQEAPSATEQSADSVIEQKSSSDDVLPQEPTEFERKNSSVGQLIYVPVYSHIYQQNRQKTFNLTTTLSIRNADPYRAFTITEVAYYDSKGDLVQQYVDSTEQIRPLASTSYVIEETDLRGGVGANFLVRWHSQNPIYPPVVEAVNISTSQQQGISFLSVGRVLQERSIGKSNN
ncbi:hypothetical protein CK503_04515 [Aliifodinibius salipaludis]|uniref:DUF3124 domain-containing protein n=1 Tax=Fodinibius salipaludis TaxID=2032627 RepID=A0A2A2GCX2_9BACT|nr:DUF3124 domain-containing protein [Aliifodinibius salipaludis]PAU94743.1 hypothetical protein CK503_04515 [Aliifodinibius salipaludis]